MNENEKLIEKFYMSFKNSDPKSMIECYHEEIEFSDPAFPLLKGKQAKAMWAFLCQRKADPNDRSFENISANEKTGSAHWEAKYIFPKTGRKVHNKIDAKFEFKDGKIIKHIDSFDFWNWSSMALGPVGSILGWTPFFQSIVQSEAKKSLDEFIAANAEFR